MEEHAGQKLELDWRHSIVDLMKLLHMDPSHENRKQLATELHYTGDAARDLTGNLPPLTGVFPDMPARSSEWPRESASSR